MFKNSDSVLENERAFDCLMYPEELESVLV